MVRLSIRHRKGIDKVDCYTLFFAVTFDFGNTSMVLS